MKGWVELFTTEKYAFFRKKFLNSFLFNFQMFCLKLRPTFDNKSCLVSPLFQYPAPAARGAPNTAWLSSCSSGSSSADER